MDLKAPIAETVQNSINVNAAICQEHKFEFIEKKPRC
jgi:hypothetical protein